MTADTRAATVEGRSPGPPPLPDRMPLTLRPFRERSFALLFTGQLSSLVGDQLYVVALPFLVLSHAGVRELGLVLMSFGAARIALVPVGGLLADRVDRARLMLLTDVGRAVCVLAVAVLALGPPPGQLVLMPLTAVLGGLEGLFLPASYAILPDVLEDDLLPAGNALTGALENGAALLGPALAGLVVALVSPGAALALDAVTFVVSAVTLLLVRTRRRTPNPTDPTDPADPEEGEADCGWPAFVRLLRTSRVVQLTLVVVLLSNLAFDAMADIALPVFARDDLQRGAVGFGIMLAAFGAGGLFGALLSDLLFRLARRGLVALGLGVLQGVAFALVPWAGGLVGACLALAVAGLTIGVLNAFYLTQVQQQVPGALLGRTMGVLTMAVFGAQPVSVLTAGLVLGQVGTAPVFIVAGALVVVGYLLGTTSTTFRNL